MQTKSEANDLTKNMTILTLRRYKRYEGASAPPGVPEGGIGCNAGEKT